MLYSFYSLIIALLYAYLGLGATLLLCPKELKRYTLFLSPVVGYCYLTILGWYCYNLDLRGTDTYAPALLVPPTIFLCYALIKWRGEPVHPQRIFHAQLIAPAAIATAAFVVISIPAILSAEGPTAVSLGNHDIATYSSTSRYLKSFARSETSGFLGQTNMFKTLADDTVFGAFLSTAFPGSVFSLKTYYLQNISINIFFLFAILLFYAVAREAFGYNHYSALMIMPLFGLSPIMYYTAYQSFLSQIIGTALALALILLHIQAINTCHKLSDYYPYITLGVMFNWAVSITYPHMLPFIYVPIVGYVLLLGFSIRSMTAVLNWGLFLFITLLATLLLSPWRAKSLLDYFILMGNVEAGWYMPLIRPDALFGLTFHRALPQVRTGLGSVLLSIPFVAFVAAGFINAYKNDRRVFILAASSILPVITGYVVLAIPGQTGDSWGGYKSYKLLSFFLPLILLGWLILFRNLQYIPRRPVSLALPLSLAMLIAGNMHSCYSQVRLIRQIHKEVSKEMADLERVESNGEVHSVNLVGSDFWDTMWQANFLLRKKLYFSINTYYPASSLDGEWNLRHLKEPADDLLRVSGFNGAETIPVNSSYLLERAVPDAPLKAQLGEGWYASEKTHRWTGNDTNVAGIVLQSLTDNLAISFRAEYWPLNQNNRISIYLNGNKVIDCPNNKSCEADSMVLHRGRNLLEFKTSIPPAPPGNGDPRPLGYAFKSIEINPSRAHVTMRAEPATAK